MPDRRRTGCARRNRDQSKFRRQQTSSEELSADLPTNRYKEGENRGGFWFVSGFEVQTNRISRLGSLNGRGMADPEGAGLGALKEACRVQEKVIAGS